MTEAIQFIHKKLFNDIRFWIVVFFIIRMYGITNPPLEVAHNWRQTTVTMVARNFLETDSDIFYPRVDFAGEKSGITGMEFPLLNYLIYMVSLIFGYSDWYGRLINLAVSSTGIYYFFKIIKKYFQSDIAFYATLVLLSSIWFAYARKIMPDTFSMSLVLIGFYYGSTYLDTGKNRFLNLLLYFVFMLFGVLSKMPSGFILVLLLLFLSERKIDIKSKIIFSITTLLILIPSVWWYFYWVPYLVQAFGFWHFFMGKDITAGINEISQNMQETLAHFYDYALKFSGFFLFVFGIVMSIRHKNKLILYILILSFLAFSIIIFKAGFTFSHHAYYIIPFVPVMALICGYGISKVANAKLRLLFIMVIVVEGILNQQHDFFIKPHEKAIMTLEGNLDKLTQPNDLILVNSGDYPTPMYFAHRKGWIASNQQINNEQFVYSVKAKGCKFIVILKQAFGTDVELKYIKIFNSEHYAIYKL